MEVTPAASPPAPPPFYQHGRGSLALNAVLIAAPAAAVALAIAIAVLMVLCREKPRQINASRSSFNSSFRKSGSPNGGSDSKRLPATATSSSSCYSPDVRSCIYGGGLGIPLHARNRGAQVFTYKELELATDGFCEGNVIGRGGFGVVFHGKLGDGTMAAIKRLHRDGKQGEREFRIEVDLLTRLHSRKLVGLLGYCADQQCRLLVFEFMPNGSLQQHLHPTSACMNQNHHPLDWWTRLRIALDCAWALEFLHEHTAPTVIHRDFKCSNILLDRDFRAKVADFGMAKIGSDKLNGRVLTRVLGTTGYLAPEYVSTGRLTTKSDVYSYGVVLLELLTGRTPVDSTRPAGEHVLVAWALPRLTNREKVAQMVDPTLKGQFTMKELVQVAAIAAVCVQSEADYRPLMTDVVQSLVPLVKLPNVSCQSTPSSYHRQAAFPQFRNDQFEP